MLLRRFSVSYTPAEAKRDAWSLAIRIVENADTLEDARRAINGAAKPFVQDKRSPFDE